MRRPFFSIVIPTFNQSNFLKEALNSVFNQDFKNFEVIVIDNYSSDETNKIIRTYKKKIIYKKIKNNGVIAKSRNLGIKKSRGKWIAFLDSDDLWSKKKLHKVYNYLKKKRETDVICNNEWTIYDKSSKTKIKSFGPSSSEFYKKILLYGNRNSTSASVVKSSFLKKNKILFNEKKSFITCEDYCFFLDIANKRGNFKFLLEPLGIRRYHSKSYSSKIKLHQAAEESVIKYHVFNVQSFSKNKKDLYNKIRKNLYIKKTFFKIFKSGKTFNNLKIFSNFVLKSPFETIKFIYSISIKFCTQIIIGAIYKK